MGLQPDGLSGEASPRLGAAADPTIVDHTWVATEWTVGSAVKQHRFWALFLASFFLWGIGVTILQVHQVAFIVDAGYGAVFATIIFSIYGAMSMIGPLCAFISDRVGREVTVTAGISFIMLGAAMLFLVNDSSHPWILYIFALAFGMGMGLNTATLGACAMDLFQGKNFGSINGVITAGFAIGAALGAYLGGLIYDLTGTYLIAFMVVEVALALAMVCVWVAAPRKTRLVPGRARSVATALLPTGSPGQGLGQGAGLRK